MLRCTCFELFARCLVIHSRGARRCRSASARDAAEVRLVREQARHSRVETTIIASVCLHVKSSTTKIRLSLIATTTTPL